MYQTLRKALKSLHISEKGMTGLETAIILIAFVTVASVLAYSVLSAGIFSAEKGKETVYSGLQSAQASTEVHGSVIGSSADNSTLNYIEFLIGLTIPDEKVDIASLVVNFYDSTNSTNVLRTAVWGDWTDGSGTWTSQISPGSTERGAANFLESDELHVVKVDVPAGFTPGAYDTFTVEVLPPTGAALTVKRALPGQLQPKMDLQ